MEEDENDDCWLIRAGFQYANDSWWGGHPMKHLVLK